MDQNSASPIIEEYREKAYKALAQVMLDSLDTGEITVEQSKEISQFVLDHLDNGFVFYSKRLSGSRRN
jgi:hypothetical protein